jgi:secreted trypsin-like serine protease
MSRLSRRFLLAAALVAAASPAHAETTDPAEDPIIGGTASPPGKWPDAVAVLGAGGSCTGTLIAPDVVLTAGHCAPVNPTRVIANTVNYNAPGGVTATVKSITAYPNSQSTYDVAVVVLTTPITGVTPRKLGTTCTFQQGYAAGTQVHLVGFGSTSVQGGGTNTALNEVTAPVIDPQCTTGNGCRTSVAPGGEFTVGGNGKDTCFGDSGGPVYLDTPRGTVVIGAVSRGFDNSANPCGDGGIYVRTDKIATWIETTTGKQISKDVCNTTPPGNGGGSGSGTGTGGGDGTGTGTGTGGGDNDGDDNGAGSADVIGGCSTGGGAGGAGLLAPLGLALTLAACRRRRAKKAQD